MTDPLHIMTHSLPCARLPTATPSSESLRPAIHAAAARRSETCSHGQVSRSVCFQVIVWIAFASISCPLFAEDSGRDAGRTELARVERQISGITALLGAAEDTLARHQAAEVETLDLMLTQWITAYQPYAGPIPQTSDENIAMYPELLKAKTGFSPMEPLDARQKAWIAHRRIEHQLYDRCVDLRVSLRNLRSLQARIRSQLGLAPSPGTP